MQQWFPNARVAKARLVAACAVAAASILAPKKATAVSYTWDGDTSATWSTVANWSGGPPGAADTAVFSLASPTFQPTVTTSTSIDGLTLNVTPELTINTSQTLTVTNATGTTGSAGIILKGAGNLSFTTTATNLNFGTGPITLDGGGFALTSSEIGIATTTGLPNTATTRSLTNDIVVTSNGGRLVMNSGSGTSGLALVFGNLQLGGTLTTSSPGGGNGDGYSIAGTVTLMQDTTRTLRITNGTSHNGSDWIAGQITDGAGSANNALRIAITGRTLQIANGTNNYAGGTIVEAGAASLNRVDVMAGGVLGTGNLTVEAGGRIRLLNPTTLGAAGNLASNATIQANGGGAVGVGTNIDISNRFTANSSGVYGMEAVNHTYNLNMAALGNGQMFLGSISGTTYTGTLSAGGLNTYRLGGGNAAGALANFVLTGVDTLSGNNNLLVGSGLNTNASYGRTIIGANQSFTGNVTVNTDGLLATRVNGGTPFGNVANAIDVYGTLAATGASGVFNSAILSKINLRPGSMLEFNNDLFANTTGGNNDNRWDDSTGITLTGSTLRLFGARTSDSQETVGALTAKDNAGLQTRRPGNNQQDVILTAAGITRVGRAVVGVSVGTAANLGADAANASERFVFTDTSGLSITNGMVAPWMVDTTGMNFLAYNAAAGTNVAGTRGLSVVAYTSTDGNTAGTNDIVNQQSTLTLSSNRSFYALRFNGDVTASGANNTISVSSGGLLFNGSNKNVSATLSSGSAEMSLWTPNGVLNFTTNGNVQTSGGLTKAGASTVNFNNTAAAAAYSITGGVVVQEGTIVSGSRFALVLPNNLLTVNHQGRLDTNNVDTTVAGLAGVGSGGNVYNNGANLRTLTINVASADTTQTYEGRLQASGTAANLAVTKTGLGTQVLAGTSLYTGATSVAAGRLHVTGSLASAVGVDASAVLSGTGSIAGAATVNGTVAGGTVGTVGTLGVGGLSLATGATLAVDMDLPNNAADLLDVTGSVSLADGTFGLTLPGNSSGDSTQTFVLIRNDGADAIAGSFAGLARSGPNDSFTFDNGTLKYTLYYGYNAESPAITGGNDVAIAFQPVPEPTSLAFLGLGAWALGRRRRRRGAPAAVGST